MTCTPMDWIPYAIGVAGAVLMAGCVVFVLWNFYQLAKMK